MLRLVETAGTYNLVKEGYRFDRCSKEDFVFTYTKSYQNDPLCKCKAGMLVRERLILPIRPVGLGSSPHLKRVKCTSCQDGVVKVGGTAEPMYFIERKLL